MTRFLAALAHARACSSPALGVGPCTAIDYVMGFLIVLAFGGFIVGCTAAVIRFLDFPIGQLFRRYGQTWALLAAAALACVCSPALADVVATASATTPVVLTTATLPWGDWLVAVLQPVSAVLVPLAAAAVTAGIAKYAPWAASVATKDRVEAAIQAGAAYGQNAVAGVAKGKVVTVNLGSAVVAAGAQHVIDEAPAKVIKAAGGVDGIATRIFRALPLEDQASAQNVLQPALDLLKAKGIGAK